MPRRQLSPPKKALDLDPDELYLLLSDRSTRFVYVSAADPLKAAQLERQKIPGFGFLRRGAASLPTGRGRRTRPRLRLSTTGARRARAVARQDPGGAPRQRGRSRSRPVSGKPRSRSSPRPERPGRNVKLTIDHQIQASAEDVGQTVRSRRRARRPSSSTSARVQSSRWRTRHVRRQPVRGHLAEPAAIASRMPTNRGRRSSPSRSRPRSRTVSSRPRPSSCSRRRSGSLTGGSTRRIAVVPRG